MFTLRQSSSRLIAALSISVSFAEERERKALPHDLNIRGSIDCCDLPVVVHSLGRWTSTKRSFGSRVWSRSDVDSLRSSAYTRSCPNRLRMEPHVIGFRTAL